MNTIDFNTLPTYSVVNVPILSYALIGITAFTLGYITIKDKLSESTHKDEPETPEEPEIIKEEEPIKEEPETLKEEIKGGKKNKLNKTKKQKQKQMKRKKHNKSR
jgi:uncharacterized protein YlxW (UPF0749 family)